MRSSTKISSAALLIVFGLAVSPVHGRMMEKEKGMMGKEKGKDMMK